MKFLRTVLFGVICVVLGGVFWQYGDATFPFVKKQFQLDPPTENGANILEKLGNIEDWNCEHPLVPCPKLVNKNYPIEIQTRFFYAEVCVNGKDANRELSWSDLKYINRKVKEVVKAKFSKEIQEGLTNPKSK